MRRREFLGILGSAAAAWPFRARAQQAGKLPRIGFLGPDRATAAPEVYQAFSSQLEKNGFREGQNIIVEYRAIQDPRGPFVGAAAERLPEWPKSYVAFVDPSGGSSDSMTLAIAHAEGKLIVLDAIREVIPPFSPNAVVEQFAELLRHYQCWTVYGDRYAGEWCREPFIQRGISYEISERSKSEIYRDFLPILNSRAVALIDNRRMRQQLLGLERRTTRGGKDSIDHSPGSHDDIANAVAGTCLCATEHGAAMPAARMPSHAFNTYDPLATNEENAIAMARAEQRSGFFSGPGWAPTWHGDESLPVRAIN